MKDHYSMQDLDMDISDPKPQPPWWHSSAAIAWGLAVVAAAMFGLTLWAVL